MVKSRHLVVVGLLTAAAALLRLPGLNSGLWFDEIVTLVESVRLPFRDVVTAFPGNNNHPFYSLLGHLSVVAFGEHAWTLRFPAFAFGVEGILPVDIVVGPYRRDKEPGGHQGECDVASHGEAPYLVSSDAYGYL